MKKYEFLRGWNQGGSVEFTSTGTSILKDDQGEIIKNFRQIEFQEVENWLRIKFCKAI
jgi:hypothetical protein